MAWQSNWINVATWGRKLVSQRAISLSLQISTLSLHYNFCSLMLSLEGLFSLVINCAPSSQWSAETDVKNMRSNLLRWLKQIEGILRKDSRSNYFIRKTRNFVIITRYLFYYVLIGENEDVIFIESTFLSMRRS